MTSHTTLCDAMSIEENAKSAASSILKDGCFSEVQNWISAKECDDIANKVREIISKYDLLKTAEYDDLIIANHTKQKELTGKLGDYPKPTIVTRGSSGYDLNVTEIFNSQKLIPVPGEISNFIKNVVKNMGHQDAKIEYSIYVNKGSSQARGFHRDSPMYEKSSKRLYKLFVYMTDVPTIDYGPHAYIPGTHRQEASTRYANQLIGNYTDPNEYDLDLNPKIFTGPKGTMVMTTQAGMHRAMPQTGENERIVLVCKIRPF